MEQQGREPQRRTKGQAAAQGAVEAVADFAISYAKPLAAMQLASFPLQGGQAVQAVQRITTQRHPFPQQPQEPMAEPEPQELLTFGC
jgi:hypothetical protein